MKKKTRKKYCWSKPIDFKQLSIKDIVCLCVVLCIFFAIILLIIKQLGYSKASIGPNGLEMVAENSTILLKSNSDELEFLNLPANMFWVKSAITLQKNKIIDIRAIGLVATIVVPFDTTIKNPNLIKESERYYIRDWVNPDGISEISFNANFYKGEKGG